MESVRKEFLCELKQIGNPEDRTIRFTASDESVDRDSDVIEVAGWQLDNFKKTGSILYGHDYRTKTGCIGKDAIKDLVTKKLYVDIYFPTVEELSTNPEYAYEMAKFPDFLYCACKLGAEMGKAACVSVGFKGIKFKTRDDPEVLEKPEWQRGRRYLEQELLELSIVEVPANANALQQLKDTGKITDKEIENFVQKGLIRSGIPAVIVETQTHETQIWKCPHCQNEIGEKELYHDGENFFHRPCKDAGAILLPDEKAEKVKGLLHVETKKPDLEGNPSVWDIMHSVRMAINPADIYQPNGPWVEDLYPIRYPSGSVILEKSSKYYLYQYEYKDGVVTLSLEFTELEETYKPKGYSKILETVPAELKEVDLLVDTNTKEVFITVNGQKTAKVKIAPEYYEQLAMLPSEFEQKSGATLSKKTKEMLNKVCEEMAGCGDRLRKFVDTSGVMEDEPPGDPPDTMMSAMRTAIAEEIKLALEDMKSQVLFVAPKDAPKVIDLDAIELPKVEKDAAQIELEIEPGQLKEMIKTLIQNSIQGR